jgi:hypothetical protein
VVCKTGWTLLSNPRQVLLYHSDPAFDRFLCRVFSIRVLRVMGKLQSPPTESLMGGRRKYNGVLPDTGTGSLVALLSVPPVPCSLWHNASPLGLVGPLTQLATYRCYLPLQWGCQRLVFGGEHQCLYVCKTQKRHLANVCTSYWITLLHACSQ